MSIRDELASLLDRHLSDRDNAQGCRLACGYDGDDRCEHLADAILARFAVVELPEPTGQWSAGPEWRDGNAVVWTAPGGTVMVQNVEPGDMSPHQARQLAAKILAAANRAEAQQ